ncbi:unnamed protein product [Microthlaspi erraticum]|uniref:Uncharacterized protein n=1 Tax=Microthlaspi erraticum TaxID=1685480 RepID=A0A6D2JHP4_9BRAS|nr:unnamed protein product [Microthlaspi erraticum]
MLPVPPISFPFPLPSSPPPLSSQMFVMLSPPPSSQTFVLPSPSPPRPSQSFPNVPDFRFPLSRLGSVPGFLDLGFRFFCYFLLVRFPVSLALVFLLCRSSRRHLDFYSLTLL